MTIRHIRIFLTVCDCGCNLTKAAEQLYTAQPAVTVAIHELERYYGVNLFDRLGRRLYLTEAGEQYREYAQRILALYDDMERGLKIGMLWGFCGSDPASRSARNLCHPMWRHFPNGIRASMCGWQLEARK